VSTLSSISPVLDRLADLARDDTQFVSEPVSPASSLLWALAGTRSEKTTGPAPSAPPRPMTRCSPDPLDQLTKPGNQHIPPRRTRANVAHARRDLHSHDDVFAVFGI
jgi:hypothetical protein